MTCIADNAEMRAGPKIRDFLRRMRRADHVIASLNDIAGDMCDLVHILKDLAVFLQEASIDEVMVLQPRKRMRIFGRCRGRAAI